MKLSREEVLHIARLSRLGLDESEVNKFSEQLSNLLESFEVLQQVDTAGVMPTAQSIALENVTRSDDTQESLPPDQILANAPEKDGDFFRIHPVLGDT